MVVLYWRRRLLHWRGDSWTCTSGTRYVLTASTHHQQPHQQTQEQGNPSSPWYAGLRPPSLTSSQASLLPLPHSLLPRQENGTSWPGTAFPGSSPLSAHYQR